MTRSFSEHHLVLLYLVLEQHPQVAASPSLGSLQDPLVEEVEAQLGLLNA